MLYMANDFDAFLNSVKYLDKEDILATAYKRHKALDKSTTMYTMEARHSFQDAISGLLYFLENKQRLAGMTDFNFAQLKPICENLIKKGEMEPEVIKIFDTI
jgi:hypothetical protein